MFIKILLVLLITAIILLPLLGADKPQDKSMYNKGWRD